MFFNIQYTYQLPPVAYNNNSVQVNIVKNNIILINIC